MSLINEYLKRLKIQKLRMQMSVCDLFAPATLREHVMWPFMKTFEKYIFNDVPPSFTNSAYFLQVPRLFDTFAWTVQIDGPPGSGKSALLKLLTRESLYFTMFYKEPGDLSLLNTLQYDEMSASFCGWVHWNFDRVLYPVQMTGLTRDQNKKY